MEGVIFKIHFLQYLIQLSLGIEFLVLEPKVVTQLMLKPSTGCISESSPVSLVLLRFAVIFELFGFPQMPFKYDA